MGLDKAKDGRLLYHLTKLDNIDSIIENNLVSRKLLIDNAAEFSDVANHEIISKRELLGLDSYIPFHFHPYSAFDVAVKNTYLNESLIYLCLQREVARDNKFKILPMHPLSIEDELVLYDYDEGMKKIDWDTLMEVGRDDTYAKHVKMAECLTELSIPISCFQCIYVKNDEIKNKVEAKLKKASIDFPPPYVSVQSCWF